ncbi:raffinose/stachyose/melibiose transport system permease protein [Quadrisphaera granulorum]|uniref:Raffinose/stachyose/melibiose transport system permease protein n=1 Tax=Quadrisphaera granulorum TaxID=317664 RepID=A0A316ADL3_9ACTN|nr:sugar ABC transporter permease [Quadrisphaera granulorum]PWJ47867.1 raffinose/stachyose/melibiose transport system permease protein [Quadrisphaera granulorum]SZE98634.1 raffinose/stachyose/melibiose transport system permease protein [Quadrisphaera granulorum]
MTSQPVTSEPLTRTTTTATRRRSRGGYLPYLLPGAIGFLLVVAVPAVANAWLSLTSWSGVGDPTFIGLDNYVRLLGDDTFWKSFANSVAIIIAMAILPTGVGLFLSAVLFDFIAPRFGGRTATTLRAMFYLPQIIPIAVAGVLWGFLLQPQTGIVNSSLRAAGLDGLAQNWLGDPALALPTVMIILVWLQLGYTIVIFMSGMARIDPSLNEAADLDGASWLQRFWVITVNELRPEIAVVLLTTTVAALKVFAPIYVLTSGGPGNATIVPSYFAFYNFFTTTQVGYGAAISTVLAVLLTALAVVLLWLQKREDKHA